MRDLFVTLLVVSMPLVAASGEDPAPVVDTGVKLNVFPLKREYFGVDTVEVAFSYLVKKNRPDGTAEVRMRNADTGEDLVKRFAIPLTVGEHHAWAKWGGAGLDTSSEASETELELEGDVQRNGLPDGLYVPQVILRDADGKVLAQHQASANEVRQLMLAGKASRVIAGATIDRKTADMEGWLAELKGLEAKARAAGANTFRPRLLIVALAETLRQLPERRGHKEYDLILYNHAYVASQVPETCRQFQRLIAEPNSALPGEGMPRTAERTTVGNGYFMAGDKPVFMAGYGMFTLWIDHLPILRDLGYNVIHVFCGPASVFPEPDAPAGPLRLGDLAGPPEGNYPVRKLLDTCQELGMKVDLGLTSNPPGWFFEKHPDACVQGQSVAMMINYDIEHPEALAWIERFYDAAMPQIAGHPALNCIWLANEPQLWNISERHVARYREHLKGKYGTIESLNRAWGTRLASFDAIRGPAWRPRQADPDAKPPLIEKTDGTDLSAKVLIPGSEPGLESALPTEGKEPDPLAGDGQKKPDESGKRAGDPSRKPEEPGKSTGNPPGDSHAASETESPSFPIGVSWGSGVSGADFWCFNMDRLTRHFEWLTQLVRKHDPTVRTAYKLNNLQMGWFVPVANVDQEAVSDLTGVVGMDSGTYPFAKPYYDWLRSLSPEKPVVNLEFKGGQYRTKLDFWKGAVSFGLAGIDWWCWHPKASFSSAMAYTVALHQGALATYDIQRLMPQVAAFHAFPRSPFVIVYPNPVRPRIWTYFQTHDPTVHALKRLSYAVDYATEKRIAEGRLEQHKYRIVVLPAANYIRDETLARIEAYVRNGGIALVIGEPPKCDEKFRPRDIGWLEAPAGAPQALDGVAGSALLAHGKGKAWRIPGASEMEMVSVLRDIAARELPPQPLELVRRFEATRRFFRVGEEQLPLKPVEGDVKRYEFENRTIPWKNAKGDSVLLTYVFNEDQSYEYMLEARFRVPVKGGVDLITGEAIDPGKIVMPPWGARLIEWTPATD